MERKKFLRSMGAGAAFAVLFPCVQGCSGGDSEGGIPEPSGIDFELDLNAAANAALQNNGGFILKNDVVVARNLQGNFVAASQICSHQQTDRVRFVTDDNGSYYCDTHGSRFTQTGAPINGVTANPLKIFNTSLSGTTLRVFG